MLISWQNLSKQFFVKISLQWFLLLKKIMMLSCLMLLIFHLNERLWRLKSILDTSKNFKSFLLNKSSVIKEILKYYIDGRLPFPSRYISPGLFSKEGSVGWMVYRYCQFTFQTCAHSEIVRLRRSSTTFWEWGIGMVRKVIHDNVMKLVSSYDYMFFNIWYFTIII